MTELEAITEAMGILKAHNGTPRELTEYLQKADGSYTTVEVMAGIAALLRRRGHNACADGVLKLTWAP
jgi:hypothetical protein